MLCGMMVSTTLDHRKAIMNLTEAAVFGLILFCAWLNWAIHCNKVAIKKLSQLPEESDKIRNCIDRICATKDEVRSISSRIDRQTDIDKRNWEWRKSDIDDSISRLAKKLTVPFYTILVGDTFSTDPDGDILIRFVQVGPDDPNARPMSGEATQYRLDRYTPVYRR